jgi:hypothetical protein
MEFNQITDFIYPIKQKIPDSNPHDLITIVNVWKLWENLWENEWAKPIENVNYYISTRILDKNHCIPVGTKLYHGSLKNVDLLELRDTSRSEQLTFFGIDIVIALWYILEMQMNYDELCVGKLYEFEVFTPIPVTLISDLFSNPKDIPHCKKDVAFIHPQVSFHDAANICDLCIEVGMRLQIFKHNLRLRKKYVVDTRILYMNAHKTFKDFNPVRAITYESEVELQPLLQVQLQ